MAKISDAFQLGHMVIKNRIVMAPLYLYSYHRNGEDYFDESFVRHYERYARGGAGMIITESVFAYGAASRTESWSDKNQAVFREIAEAIHRHQAAAILQISLGRRIPDINRVTGEDMRRLQNNLYHAALLAYQLGFDGVEYHCAHENALATLFDGVTNKRTDEFGGIPSRRVSVLTEIISRIKSETKKEFLVLVRMGSLLPTMEEAADCAKSLVCSGVDAFDFTYSMVRPEEKEGSFNGLSPMVMSGSRLGSMISVPVMVSGGIFSEAQAQAVLGQEMADFVVIGRGMLADPDFANHVLNHEPVRKCFQCKTCRWFEDGRLCPARIRDVRL